MAELLESRCAAPGTLVRLVDEQVPPFFQTKISNHQVGLSDLLALLALKDEAPKYVTIIGVVPYALDNTLGLSEETLHKVEAMLRMVLDELALAGVVLVARDQPLPCFWAGKTREEPPLPLPGSKWRGEDQPDAGGPAAGRHLGVQLPRLGT